MLNTELMIRENALFKLIKLNKFKTPSNPIIDINFKDQYGYSAIEYAVLQANVEKAQSYINEGAQVTQDLFLSALRVGNLKVLNLLLPHFKDKLKWWHTYCQNQPTLSPEERQDYAFFGTLFAQLPYFPQQSIEFLKDQKVLHDYSLMRDFIIKIRYIDECVEPFPGKPLQDPATLDFLNLYFPIVARDQKAIEALLQKNTDIKAQFYFPFGPFDGPQKLSLLQVAILKNNVSLVENLLAKDCDLSQRDQEQKNALFTAIETQNIPIIKLLLKNNIPLVKDFHGQTALHFAAELGNEDVISTLLEDRRFNSEVQSSYLVNSIH